MTDTPINPLVINELSEAQYADLPSEVKNSKELFLTPDNTTTEISAAIANHNSSPTAHGALLNAKQDVSNLVTSVSAASTDSQYPSAKLFYDTCGDIETLINAL